MDLSVRERDVLDAVDRASSTNTHALAQVFESRFPADELDVVVASLRLKNLVLTIDAARGEIVSITRFGRREMKLLRGGGSDV